MLSDTLFDARNEIEHYESQYADEYREIGPALTKVKIIMRAMQAACDLCPTTQHARAWRIIGAIESLDTSTLTQLLDFATIPAKKNPGN